MQRIANTLMVFLFVFTTSAMSSEMKMPSPYVVLEDVGNKLFSRIAETQLEIQKFTA
jgi:ABC-type transporter MlaC component